MDAPPAMVRLHDLGEPKKELRLYLDSQSRVYLDGELVDSVPDEAELVEVEHMKSGRIVNVWYKSVPAEDDK